MAFKLTEGWDLHSVHPITQMPDRLSLPEQNPPMRIKPVLILLSCICLQMAFIGIVWSQTQTQKCNTQLAPLKKTKNAIIGDGGMWALFEHSKVLQEKSSKAIQLDSKVQQLVWLLDYLCKTTEGVPLNELATYLTQNLKEKTKPQFKQELVILGKTEAEIDIWFIFSDVSLKNETRQLDLKTVYNSIQKSLPLLLEYKSLAEEADQSPNKKQIESVNNLYQKIEQLESSDPYLAQALLETAQVPHWDIDESTGGS